MGRAIYVQMQDDIPTSHIYKTCNTLIRVVSICSDIAFYIGNIDANADTDKRIAVASYSTTQAYKHSQL